MEVTHVALQISACRRALEYDDIDQNICSARWISQTPRAHRRLCVLRRNTYTLAGWRYVMFKDSDTPAGMGGPQKVSVE